MGVGCWWEPSWPQKPGRNDIGDGSVLQGRGAMSSRPHALLIPPSCPSTLPVPLPGSCRKVTSGVPFMGQRTARGLQRGAVDGTVPSILDPERWRLWCEAGGTSSPVVAGTWHSLPRFYQNANAGLSGQAFQRGLKPQASLDTSLWVRVDHQPILCWRRCRASPWRCPWAGCLAMPGLNLG